ncbi:MAG: Gfo/Idh/MocA family oxidoreductase, partial [Rhodococcus sp.]|nr:Gfo/Idh/MocA family oxidoreductase [Rhodococcus sp. (in: high G+C Gram-positive bacteria)]
MDAAFRHPACSRKKDQSRKRRSSVVHRSNRRQFLGRSTAAGIGVAAAGLFTHSIRGAESPNEKLNVAVIGVGGRGAGNLAGVAGQNVVALCDVDEARLDKAAASFPAARKHVDFRKMLGEMADEIDAVVVSTPDHTHAPASAMAIRMGKHCYCEKPLAHNVWEAREVTRLAAEKGVATQMGTQIHAGENYRRVVELIHAGAIGPVEEVHVWCGKGWGGGTRPTETPPVPETLHWDLWLGPAPYRPYHS